MDKKDFDVILPKNTPAIKDEFKSEKPNKLKRGKTYTQEDLFNEQVREQMQRRRFRCVMFWAFFVLLVAQHGFLVWFIGYAAGQNLISDIQPLLAIIIPATLGETYAVIHIMVKYIFSPGDFGFKNNALSKK